jgi:protoporphyrinogen IX oxidase
MLWIKSFHIIFIASWFAGLFYLPRLYVNLADVPDLKSAEGQRLLGMSRRLYRFMTLLAVPALILGLWLWLGYGIGQGSGNAWMHGKLGVVAVLMAYHYVCGRLLVAFEQGRNTHRHTWYRWFNELPVLLMTVAVILVVVKPF